VEQRDNKDFWDLRAKETFDEDLVTHRDAFQKRLELDFIDSHLESGMSVLEPGCGNGYVTKFLSSRVSSIDGFDISEEMVNRARSNLAATGNCRFFVKALPAPDLAGLANQYDAIICVRVVINLPNVAAQVAALAWFADRLRPGGKLILLEGSQEGPAALNDLRRNAGMSDITAPLFNINLERGWLEAELTKHFEIMMRGGIGVYDYLTRFYYPCVAGEDNVKFNTDFQRAAYTAASLTPSNEFMDGLSRLHAVVATKR
jgi:SAM-dependent methyltransferase